VIASVCFVGVYVFLLPAIRDVKYFRPVRVNCMANLRNLGLHLAIYADDYDDVYPRAERWCDAIVDAFGSLDSNVRSLLRCPRAKTESCSYALNPNAGRRRAHDVVLLFESKPGWNQSGGPELLTTENHQGKGCTVLFTDLHVEFVKTQDLGRLKWDYADSSQSNQSVPSRDN